MNLKFSRSKAVAYNCHCSEYQCVAVPLNKMLERTLILMVQLFFSIHKYCPPVNYMPYYTTKYF